MDRTKNRIKNIFKLYKEAFPEEYKTFCEGMEVQRQMMRNEFASVKDSKIINRALHEMPEKLYIAILQELESEELEYLKSVDGARWFAKAFPECALATKI